MPEAQDRRHLLVSFNFHPTQGSEEAVGWVFARLSAECAPTVVYTQASYEEKMTAADRAALPENLEVRYYDPRWLKAGWKSRLMPVSVYFKLWHLGLYFHLREVLKEERFSLCHVCTWVSAVHPVATLLLRLPTLWGPLGGVARPPFSFYRRHGLGWMAREAARALSIAYAPVNVLLRKTFGEADLVLAAAHDCRDWIVEHGLAPRERVRVLPAITFPRELVEAARAEGGRPVADRAVEVVSAARLLPWKGVDLLLEALAQSGRRDLRVRVFGDGPDRGRLERLAEQLAVSGQVEFAGRVPREEVLRAMGAADAFVLPSLHDSEAGACMEAAGLGVSVVALDYGGARSCMRGCAMTTFLTGTTREAVIRELAGHLAGLERLRERGAGPHGNIPADSLLLYPNKRVEMHRIYDELVASGPGS